MAVVGVLPYDVRFIQTRGQDNKALGCKACDEMCLAV